MVEDWGAYRYALLQKGNYVFRPWSRNTCRRMLYSTGLRYLYDGVAVEIKETLTVLVPLSHDEE